MALSKPVGGSHSTFRRRIHNLHVTSDSERVENDLKQESERLCISHLKALLDAAERFASEKWTDEQRYGQAPNMRPDIVMRAIVKDPAVEAFIRFLERNVPDANDYRQAGRVALLYLAHFVLITPTARPSWKGFSSELANRLITGKYFCATYAYLGGIEIAEAMTISHRDVKLEFEPITYEERVELNQELHNFGAGHVIHAIKIRLSKPNSTLSEVEELFNQVLAAIRLYQQAEIRVLRHGWATGKHLSVPEGGHSYVLSRVTTLPIEVCEDNSKEFKRFLLRFWNPEIKSERIASNPGPIGIAYHRYVTAQQSELYVPECALWAVSGIEALLSDAAVDATRNFVTRMTALFRHFGADLSTFPGLMSSIYAIRSNHAHGKDVVQGNVRSVQTQLLVEEPEQCCYGIVELLRIVILVSLSFDGSKKELIKDIDEALYFGRAPRRLKTAIRIVKSIVGERSWLSLATADLNAEASADS